MNVRKKRGKTIQSQLAQLQRKYDELKQKMEDQHLENIQSDELLLKYFRKRM